MPTLGGRSTSRPRLQVTRKSNPEHCIISRTPGPCSPKPSVHHDDSSNKVDYGAKFALKDHVTETGPRQFWRGSFTGASHFVLDLGCVAQITSITLRNGRNGNLNDSGVRKYSITTRRSQLYPWSSLASGEMPDPTSNANPPPLVTLSVGGEGKLVKFSCETYWGKYCALHYIKIN